MSECGCVELMWRGGTRTDADPGTKPIVTRIYRTLDGQAKNRLQYKPASFRPGTCPAAVWISIFYSPSSTLSVSRLPIDRDGPASQTSTRVLTLPCLP